MPSSAIQQFSSEPILHNIVTAWLSDGPALLHYNKDFDARRKGNQRNSQMIALCYKMHNIDYSSRSRGNIKHRLLTFHRGSSLRCPSAKS